MRFTDSTSIRSATDEQATGRRPGGRCGRPLESSANGRTTAGAERASRTARVRSPSGCPEVGQVSRCGREPVRRALRWVRMAVVPLGVRDVADRHPRRGRRRGLPEERWRGKARPSSGGWSAVRPAGGRCRSTRRDVRRAGRVWLTPYRTSARSTVAVVRTCGRTVTIVLAVLTAAAVVAGVRATGLVRPSMPAAIRLAAPVGLRPYAVVYTGLNGVRVVALNGSGHRDVLATPAGQPLDTSAGAVFISAGHAYLLASPVAGWVQRLARADELFPMLWPGTVGAWRAQGRTVTARYLDLEPRSSVGVAAWTLPAGVAVPGDGARWGATTVDAHARQGSGPRLPAGECPRHARRR